MDWNTMRQQWQAERTPPPEVSLDDLRARDRALHTQVRRRDLLETLAAVLVMALFGFETWHQFGLGHRSAAAFAGFVVLWAVCVPVRLWRARRLLIEPDPDRCLRDYLIGQRDAMRMQAKMLENAWLWYVAPVLIGVVGFMWSLSDVPPTVPSAIRTVVYGVNIGVTVGVIAFGVGIAYLNRRVARTRFGSQVERVERHLASLMPEDRA